MSDIVSNAKILTRSAPLWRVLLCHKHPVSARLRFLVPERRGVCLPWHLPALTVFYDVEKVNQANIIDVHPVVILKKLQVLVPIKAELFVVPGFRVSMETPAGVLPVYLVSMEGNALPAAPTQLRWIELPQSIGFAWLDHELLRRAYEFLLG